MLAGFFTVNFMTLMILSALLAVMAVNRRTKLPAADLYFLAIGLLFVILIADTASNLATERKFDVSLPTLVKIRTIADATSYILRPFIIFTEVLIILPNRRYKALCAIPAAVNTIIYSTAFTDSKLAFEIGPNMNWGRGPFGMSVYYSQFFYVFMLVMFSIEYFKSNNYRKCFIIWAIILQSLIVAYVEYRNILPGCTNPVTALCIFEYYTYLSVLYQQDMRETIAQKDLKISRDKMLILKNQIQPHFIYNSLSIIRSLAKRDGARAVECIDNFSDYLKAHIGAIQTDELVPFDKELYNVKVYLSLVQADYTRKVEVEYELGVTDFLIPPLSLEPIVENAVNHGISSKGGKITLKTFEQDNSITVRIKDNGSGKKGKDEYKPVHMGVGIDNTRKRLEVMCGGSLIMDIADSGATVDVIIPKRAAEKGEENEDTDS